MRITDEMWVVNCESIAQKKELFDYAEAKGVPVLKGPVNYEQYLGGESYYDDADLQIAYCDTEGSGFPSGIMSCSSDTSSDPITADQFRAMCDAYPNEPVN